MAEETAAAGGAEPVAGAVGPVGLDEEPVSPAGLAEDDARSPREGPEVTVGTAPTAPAGPARPTPGPTQAATGDGAAEAAPGEADRDQLTLFSPA